MTSTARSTQSPRARFPMRLIALTPVWFGPVIYLAAPRYFGPNPVLFGIPQDLVMVLGAMTWALIGVAIAWHARSWLVDVLTVLLFTLPAILFIIIGPAIVLILQNLD